MKKLVAALLLHFLLQCGVLIAGHTELDLGHLQVVLKPADELLVRHVVLFHDVAVLRLVLDSPQLRKRFL